MSIGLDYFRCEVCWAQLMHPEPGNEGKFPVTRRFKDSTSNTSLLSVRCAECVNLPYKLEAGQPHRSDLIGKEDITVIPSSNSTYNYWPHGIGHVLEVFVSPDSEEAVSFLKTAPVEIGFLTEEAVNLIVVAYRFAEHDWNVTPFLWHAYHKSLRAVPPENPCTDENFTIAAVHTTGGKYVSVRVGKMPVEFCRPFQRAILDQIARGTPGEEYKHRVHGLWDLLMDNKVDSMLQARCIL